MEWREERPHSGLMVPAIRTFTDHVISTPGSILRKRDLNWSDSESLVRTSPPPVEKQQKQLSALSPQLESKTRSFDVSANE